MYERLLQSCGPSWFIVYAYFEKIDKNELRWQAAGTLNTRINAYKRIVAENDYKEIVKTIIKKDLKQNSFDVPVDEVYAMGKKY